MRTGLERGILLAMVCRKIMNAAPLLAAVQRHNAGEARPCKNSSVVPLGDGHWQAAVG